MLFSIPTFITASALRIFSILVPQGTCSQTLFLALPTVQSNTTCNPPIANFVSNRIISGAEATFQLSSHTDWILYVAPLGCYAWDSSPYLRDITSKAVTYAHYTNSAVRRVFYAPGSKVSTELAIVPTFVRPPGCWSDDHEVTLAWLGISLPFLVLPAPTPFLVLPAPARVLTLPAPVPILTLPAPVLILTLPAPAQVLTLPAPVPILTLPAPVPILALPAPVPILTLPASAPVLTLPAPKVIPSPATPELSASGLLARLTTTLDASRFKRKLSVYFLGLEWHNIASGGCILALTLLPHFLARLLFGGRARYRMTASSFPVEAALDKHELGFVDPFDGLALDAIWTPPTRGHLAGLAPDLFRFTDTLLAANSVNPPTESQEDNIGVVTLELAQVLMVATMDERLDDQQNVVDSPDEKNDLLDRPLESRSDEPVGALNVEQSEVLPTNDSVDSPTAATGTVDDQEGWTVVQSRSRRRRTPSVEAPSASSGQPQSSRGPQNRGGSRGGRSGKKGAEKPRGRNGGRNEGGGGANGRVGGGGADGGNRSNGSQGSSNGRRRGESGQNEGGRSEGRGQRLPADITFQRRLPRRSVAAAN